jgi:hypothetical protein
VGNLALALNRDGSSLLAFASTWAHLVRLDSDKRKVQVSRFLPGMFPPSARVHLRSPEAGGELAETAVCLSLDSVAPVTLRFDGFDGPPLEGDPEELLDQWQKKLALRINDQGEIVPSNPGDQPGEESRSSTKNGP